MQVDLIWYARQLELAYNLNYFLVLCGLRSPFQVSVALVHELDGEVRRFVEVIVLSVICASFVDFEVIGGLIAMVGGRDVEW